ncbi:unnamed protein product [Polarella glacialis]|uniref:Uncharacterized protein n=1 Tax=Polarella glacialis TaxID=89957 RepID=A0A813DWE4_POLGL|nr:unnamed protein product [Polarella glacialis]
MSLMLCFGSEKTKSPTELGLLARRKLETEKRFGRRKVRKAIAMPTAPGKKKAKAKPPEVRPDRVSLQEDTWPGLPESTKSVKKGVVLTPAGGGKDTKRKEISLTPVRSSGGNSKAKPRAEQSSPSSTYQELSSR